MNETLKFVEEYFQDLYEIHQTGGGVKEEWSEPLGLDTWG